MKNFFFNLLILFIIFGFSFSIFSNLFVVNQVRNKELAKYESALNRERDLVSLFIATSLEPRSSRLASLVVGLSERGDYQAAKSIAELLNKKELFLTIAEQAALNNDIHALKKLQEKIDEREYLELENFIRVISREEDYLAVSEPLTDPGRLLKIINEKRFDDYGIKGFLGKEILIIKNEDSSDLKKRIKLGRLLNEYKLEKVTLYLVKRIQENNLCLREPYVLEIETLDLVQDFGLALEASEQYLNCFPADEQMLRTARFYSGLLKNNSKSEYYGRKIKEIERIKR